MIRPVDEETKAEDFPFSERIRNFYDASSALWENAWGEHMHHGYYGADGAEGRAACFNPRIAQVRLIDEIIAWSGIRQPRRILDVGCGIGGSTLHLAQRYGASAEGITLSPVQAQRAKERAGAAGLEPMVRFRVANALAMPYPDDSFDLVWSLESGEHMPDKQRFLSECHRVLSPGGRLMVATWCHREVEAPAGPLSAREQALLNLIYGLYHLPGVIPLSAYGDLARQLPLEQLRLDDWTVAVAPFWRDVLASAFRPRALQGLLSSSWDTLRGAAAVPLMMAGYDRGLIRYGLFTGTKP